MPRKLPKNNNKIDKFIVKPQARHISPSKEQEQQEIQENTQTPRPRRIVKMTDFLTKANESTVETKHQETFQLPKLLSEVTANEILLNCPRINEWAQHIMPKNELMRDRFLIVIQRFFRSLPNSLMSNKYQPRSLIELFDQKIAEKISLWIKCYTQCRHHEVVEHSNSFIDDFDYEDEGNQSLFLVIHKNNWKCRALILKGNPNIGKTSLVRVLSHQLNYKIHECSVDLNQQKYLKQNNQSTKSENIQIIPRNLKIERTNHNISRYFPSLSENKSERSQRNALQFIRDFDRVYPENNRQKFYKVLNQSINQSKVPFILTTVSFDFPQDYLKYDYIELEQLDTKKIASFFWLICTVERSLRRIDRKKKIKKDDLWEELNEQFNSEITSEGLSLQVIEDIVRMFRSNLSKVFNFLQFSNIADLYRQASFFAKKITAENLLRTHHDRVYLQSKQKEDYQKSNMPKTAEGTNQNIDFVQNPQKQRELQILQIKKMLQDLQLRRFNDFKMPKRGENQFTFHKLYEKEEQIEDSLWMNIPVEEHLKAKKSICEDLNRRGEKSLFIDENHMSSLRTKQLPYLPMMAVVRKSRKAQITFQETLNRLMDKNKVRYLLQFRGIQSQSTHDQ